MANITDGRCWRELKPDSPSLLQNGNLVFQAHHVGWIISGFFTVVAIIASAWLMNKHLQFYTNKREQRYIVRILFMVPIYAIVSLASYLFWNHSTALLLIRDGYESTVLTSFFYLLLNYISHDPDEQRTVFMKNGLSREADREALRKGQDPKKWMFPMGFVKWKPSDGLLFLQLMKWGVLQYCVLRPTTTLAAVVLNYMGLYCEDSWGIGWGHIYITVIVSLSVTVAMYCLIQLYIPVSAILKPQKPLLKLFSVKAIVFLTFWQATFLSVLSMFGVVKDTTYMTADDINIGIGALLETFEMMLFGFLHIKAFTYKPYSPDSNPESKEPSYPRMTRMRALGHAMDFRETFRELWGGTVYLWDKMRGREPTIDIGAKRFAHYESAFGAARPSAMSPRRELNEKADPLAFPMIRVEREEIFDTSPRQWLGYGTDYGYGFHREKSDDLEVQIERELQRRGIGSEIPGRGHIKPVGLAEEQGYDHRPQRSWWQSIYNRISQSGTEEDGHLTRGPSRRVDRAKSREPSKSRSRNRSRDADFDRGLLTEQRYDMDDPPPPSLFRAKRSSQNSSRDQALYHPVSPYGDEDLLSPLSGYNDHRSSLLQRQMQQRNSGHRPAPPLSPSGYPASPSSPPPLSSSPPPKSLLSPMMPFGFGVSADSLLGRVFPSKSSDADLSAHGTDNTHSTGNPRTTPRTAPPSNENGHEIGMAGERSPVQAQQGLAVSPPGVHQPLAATTMDYLPAARPAYTEMPVPYMPRTEDMYSARAFGAPEVGPPVPTTNGWGSRSPPPRPATASPTSNGASRGLRRSSAQVYSPREAPGRRDPQPHALQRQSRRLSTPVTLTVPRPLVTPPENAYPADRSNARPSPTARYIADNNGSTVAQPSFSGTVHSSKYPDVLADSGVQGSDYTRYPGMPSKERASPSLTTQQAQSDQRAYKYPSHSQYSRGGANNSRPSNAQDRPTRGPWS